MSSRPRRRLLVERLRERRCRHRGRIACRCVAASCRVSIAATPRDELESAARWAADWLDREPGGASRHSRVRTSVTRRAEVRRALEQVLLPGAGYVGGPLPESRVFAIADAPPLSERAVVDGCVRSARDVPRCDGSCGLWPPAPQPLHLQGADRGGRAARDARRLAAAERRGGSAACAAAPARRGATLPAAGRADRARPHPRAAASGRGLPQRLVGAVSRDCSRRSAGRAMPSRATEYQVAERLRELLATLAVGRRDNGTRWAHGSPAAAARVRGSCRRSSRRKLDVPLLVDRA